METRKYLRHDGSRSLSLPKAQAGGLRQAQSSLQSCTFLYDKKINSDFPSYDYVNKKELFLFQPTSFQVTL